MICKCFALWGRSASNPIHFSILSKTGDAIRFLIRKVYYVLTFSFWYSILGKNLSYSKNYYNHRIPHGKYVLFTKFQESIIIFKRTGNL